MKLSVSFQQGLKSLAAFSITWKKKKKKSNWNSYPSLDVKAQNQKLVLSILSQILTPAWD